MGRLRELLAVVAIVLTSAAAACSAAPLTGPRQGGASWRVLKSPHFMLETDVEPAVARGRLAEFEVMYDALGTVIRHSSSAAAQPIEIVLFARAEDFAAITGRERGLGGFFTEHAPGDLEPRPALVFADGIVTATQRVFLHELTHRFVRENFTDPPTWLNEGLAEYFSTLRIEGRRIVLGERLPNAAFSSGSSFSESWYFQDRQVRLDEGSFFERETESRARYRQLQIPVTSAPTVAALVMASREAFYAWAREGQPSDDELHVQSAYYAGSWKLVHLLSNGPDAAERDRFQAYLARMAAGAKPDDAFREAFGADATGRLQALYARELENQAVGVRNLEFTPHPPAPIDERPLSDAAVHLLWARHRVAKKGFEAARADVAAALASDPSSADARFERAVLAMKEGHFDEAGRDLDAAIAMAPNDPRYLVGRVVLEGERAQAGGRLIEVPNELVERLAKTATTATELESVALAEGRRGRVKDGLELSERAVRLDPLCWSCQYTRAAFLFGSGQLIEARAAATRALALLPERFKSKAYTALIRKIDVAIAKGPKRETP